MWKTGESIQMENKENNITLKIDNFEGPLELLLYLIDKKKLNTIGGFVHVPYIPEQVVSKPSGTPSMSRGIIIEALQLIIKTVAKNTDIQK